MSITISSRAAARAQIAVPTRADIQASSASDRIVKALAFTVFMLSSGFFCAVTVISYLDPNYFDRMLISSVADNLDTMAVGSTEKAGSLNGVAAIPAPTIVRSVPLKPQDYAIVMVFQNEAHLASPGELWRVKVGSVLPGLGKILAIEPNEEGGIVKAEHATLKAMNASQ
ncbi:hypothetical protein [Aurantimonas sp. VKM B-3413]|uniref:hypothetical protein n=1 Tax=Aurantimonas sp. VKM B-3413 TaxID=2779401 RepID=UPI001E446BDF|nr:hypothetical protein [Aurantimonas sp. VKM B-3413]MCB8838120.1 hypothetical protein [Aurantimonas sp. VKM B-3413]